MILVQKDFKSGEKLALRWRGPRRILEPLNVCVHQIEDLRIGQIEDVHISLLKFYLEGELDTGALMPHVLNSETGMLGDRVMELVRKMKDVWYL